MNSVGFGDWSDDQIEDFLKSQSFVVAKKLDSGDWIGIIRLAFTYAVCCGIEKDIAFKYRWCFEGVDEAIHFFENCKEFDEIPKKRNSLKGHRYINSPLLMMFDERGFPKW